VPRLLASLILGLTLLPRSAAGQWASLGDMPRPTQSGNTVTFKNAQGVVAVTAIAPDIIRVRFAPGNALGRDHSWAVVGHDLGAPDAKIQVAGDRTTLSTPRLVVTLTHRPFRVSIADTSGTVIDADDKARGIAFSGATTRVWKVLPDDAQLYGLGEKNGHLNKRGRQLGGYNVTMWNSDTFAYEADTDPIYVDVPFYLVLWHGRAHGVFFDNTFRSNFDVGHTSPGLMAFGAEGGEMNYYVIDGPAMKDVVKRFTDLTGKLPLPPLWSLGYNQCRYSYYPESKVRFIADNFRVRQIPADVIWLDIHYQDGYAPFTWDKERFPDPPKLIADLKRQGFRLVTIVDPHIKRQPGAPQYDSGIAGDMFVRAHDGSIYEGPVWPSHAEKSPGPSVFPDFTKPAARQWWGTLFKPFVEMGVAGIWNDMDEPAVFSEPTGTMPLDVKFYNEGEPTDQREIHNVYGLLTSRATHEGLKALRPDERPFVLTRATYAGGQRYAAQWPGDNVSDWTAMRGAIPTLLGMGLSGLSFVGVDVGGFAEAPTSELYTRWLQSGLLYPFYRTHTTYGTPDQEPWSYGMPWEDYNRRTIELRYELLPEIYNVMHETSVTGLPAMRPLVLEYPDDPATYGLDDEYMFGSDVLLAPVLREAATTRSFYLPKGGWIEVASGRHFEGGRGHTMPVTMASIPLFVKAGAFIFRQPVVQYTSQMPGQPLIVEVYGGASGNASLYEDDGLSFKYEQGQSMTRRFTQERSGSSVKVSAAAGDGQWHPAARQIRFVIQVDHEPSRVTVNGNSVPRARTPSVGGEPSGPEPGETPSVRPEPVEGRTATWSLDDRGFVVIELPDSFGAISVEIGN
jgi:alpha-glucosidase